MTCNCVNPEEQEYVKLDSLLTHVTTQIPQLPYEYSMYSLRQAFIKFARKTSLVTQTYNITLQKDVCDYDLIPPKDYIIHQIKVVRANGCCSYRPASPDYWFCCGYGFYFRHGRIVFGQKPSKDQEDAVKVTVILIPKDCVVDIPEFIAVPYGKGIASSTLADAFRMPNKVWGNLTQAALHEREFSLIVQAGKNLAMTEGIPANSRLHRVRWV